MNRVEYFSPIDNAYRHYQALDGDWYIAFGRQLNESYEKGVPHQEMIPVPGSFRHMYLDRDRAYFLGPVWYERETFIPKTWLGEEVFLRFSHVPERISIYVNGIHAKTLGPQQAATIIECTKYLRYDDKNIIVIKSFAQDASYRTGGLTMDISLFTVPTTRILDVTWQKVSVVAGKAILPYVAKLQGNSVVTTTLRNREGKIVATAVGNNASLTVDAPNFWSTSSPYLYTVDFEVSRLGKQTDCYTMQVGIREGSVLQQDAMVAVTTWNDDPVWQKRHVQELKRYGYTGMLITERDISTRVAKLSAQEGIEVYLQLPIEPLEALRETSFFRKEEDSETRNILHTELMEEYKHAPAIAAWHITLPSVTPGTKDLLPSYLNFFSKELEHLNTFDRPVVLEVALEEVKLWESLFFFVDAVVVRITTDSIGAKGRDGADLFVQLGQKLAEIRTQYSILAIYPLWNMKKLDNIPNLLLQDGLAALEEVQVTKGKWFEGSVAHLSVVKK